MKPHRAVFFALFTLSGFSGLIYESIWTHYLKLFLGHAAYAQTLVLAIFMGGLALGSWACSRYSARWKNLVLAYALVEGLIGLAALGFHEVFDGFLQLSFSTIIPALGTPTVVIAYKWLTASALILPQSTLLGMTFPLMSAGILRRYADHPGGTVAMLYFTNSIGAVFGVLLSGFVLIAAIGLPGTIRSAGAINLLLAATVWMLTRGSTEPKLQVATQTNASSGTRGQFIFLTIALLTGAASFIYEIVWIRLLSLVLGSSTHAFELMLSAFILGLALGGLWIKFRIDRIHDPIRTLATIQIVMGALALATLPIYNQSFEAMVWILGHVPRDETGYLQFNLGSHAIAAAIMLPATFCAGMTLPLLTYILLKAGHGEKSIGRVYAANTVGAIVGVFFATHLGMPLLGAKNLLTFGAGLDIALGALLIGTMLPRAQRRIPIGIAIAGAAGLVASTLLVHLSPVKMASGVYRYGQLPDENAIVSLFHADGKTATVDVVSDRSRRLVTISTNGKPDASINMAGVGAPSPDESTMVLAGALPFAMRPRTGTAAVIGFGSGLSTHTLAGISSITSVDTVEIESAMVEGAKNFRPRVDLAYRDATSHVHIDDAKTFFTTHNKTYDIIASEPSNPWVSGVSGLFSDQFYGLIKRYLTPDGVLVQWIQAYEIDVELIASIVKALSIHFPNYVLYAANDDDLLLIASRSDAPLSPSARLFAVPEMARELARHGINGMPDLLLHKIGDRAALQPLFESYAIPANSDYYPVLDTRAALTRFMRRGGTDLLNLAKSGIPAAKFLGREETSDGPTRYTPNPFLTVSDPAFAATLMRDYVLTGRMDAQFPRLSNDAKFYTENVRADFVRCEMDVDPASWVVSAVGFAQLTLPFLSPVETEQIWHAAQSAPCHGARGSTKKTWIQLLIGLSKRDAATMSAAARQLLDDAERDPPPVARFLLQAAVLGDLLQKQPEPARALWQRLQPTVYPDDATDLTARLYRAHLGLH